MGEDMSSMRLLLAAALVAPVAAQHPCGGQMTTCANSAKMIPGPNAGVIDNPQWALGQATWEMERGKCGTGLMACYENGQDCEMYFKCAPAALNCMLAAVASAYARFATTECDALIICMRDAPAGPEAVCNWAFAKAFVLPNPTAGAPNLLCPVPDICAEAAKEGFGDSDCKYKTKMECDDESDCTWHAASGACWEDYDGTRFIVEVIGILIGALCLCCACLWCLYFMFVIRPRRKTEMLYEKDPYEDEAEYDLDMGRVPPPNDPQAQHHL